MNTSSTYIGKRGSIAIAAFLLFLPGVAGAAQDRDSDGDGLTDYQESFVYFSDPQVADTDGDSFPDGGEVKMGYSPLVPKLHMYEHDLDGDGLNDWAEVWFGSSANNIDSDGDGFTDFDEVMYGYSPSSVEPTVQFKRKIVIDKTLQRLYFYVDTIKILNLAVSTGNPSTQTPSGSFSIERKLPVKRYVGPGYDLPGVEWNMQFKPMYYIHGAYWHNYFGLRTASHGCVNMSTKDAGLIYPYVNIGFDVEIIGETPAHQVVGL